MKVIELVTKHMKRPTSSKLIWTLEAVTTECSKYKSKGEWKTNSPSSYNSARKNKWISDLCKNMQRPPQHNKIWIKNRVIDKAKQYSNKSDWQKNCGGSFLAAHRNGWIQEASVHMMSFRGCNKPEMEILGLIRQYCPNAKTKRFKNLDPNFSFKCLELDIFIPELNKGVEFDGSYWHRPEVLRRYRSHWKESEISNYSETKDLFFKTLNIEVLHISEDNWKKAKKDCLKAILIFIGVT